MNTEETTSTEETVETPQYLPLGRNAAGQYGELSDEFPFTDETTEGKVLRQDGAIVNADGSSTVYPGEADESAVSSEGESIADASDIDPFPGTSGDPVLSDEESPAAQYFDGKPVNTLDTQDAARWRKLRALKPREIQMLATQHGNLDGLDAAVDAL